MDFINIMLFYVCSILRDTAGQEQANSEKLLEYVLSECYGDLFSFDCGHGNKIRIVRDFFGVGADSYCHYRSGDCTISNPNSNSLLHRYCTGRQGCSYFPVERRGCNGRYSKYQQLEYQCIPESSINSICTPTQFETSDTYIASPNFPDSYPPNQACSCAVRGATSGVRVRLEIVYLAIKFSSPCRDWLRIGRRKTCGTSSELFTGRRIPVEFRSDGLDGHAGFWLHFQATIPGEKIQVVCGASSNFSGFHHSRPQSSATTNRPSIARFLPKSSTPASETKSSSSLRLNNNSISSPKHGFLSGNWSSTSIPPVPRSLPSVNRSKEWGGGVDAFTAAIPRIKENSTFLFKVYTSTASSAHRTVSPSEFGYTNNELSSATTQMTTKQKMKENFVKKPDGVTPFTKDNFDDLEPVFPPWLLTPLHSLTSTTPNVPSTRSSEIAADQMLTVTVTDVQTTSKVLSEYETLTAFSDIAGPRLSLPISASTTATPAAATPAAASATATAALTTKTTKTTTTVTTNPTTVTTTALTPEVLTSPVTYNTYSREDNIYSGNVEDINRTTHQHKRQPHEKTQHSFTEHDTAALMTQSLSPHTSPESFITMDEDLKIRNHISSTSSPVDESTNTRPDAMDVTNEGVNTSNENSVDHVLVTSQSKPSIVNYADDHATRGPEDFRGKSRDQHQTAPVEVAHGYDGSVSSINDDLTTVLLESDRTPTPITDDAGFKLENEIYSELTNQPFMRNDKLTVDIPIRNKYQQVSTLTTQRNTEALWTLTQAILTTYHVNNVTSWQWGPTLTTEPELIISRASTTTLAPDEAVEDDTTFWVILVVCCCISVGVVCIIVTISVVYVRRRRRQATKDRRTAHRLSVLSRGIPTGDPTPLAANSRPHTPGNTSLCSDFLLPSPRPYPPYRPSIVHDVTSCGANSLSSGPEDTYTRGRGHPSYIFESDSVRSSGVPHRTFCHMTHIANQNSQSGPPGMGSDYGQIPVDMLNDHQTCSEIQHSQSECRESASLNRGAVPLDSCRVIPDMEIARRMIRDHADLALHRPLKIKRRQTFKLDNPMAPVVDRCVDTWSTEIEQITYTKAHTPRDPSPPDGTHTSVQVHPQYHQLPSSSQPGASTSYGHGAEGGGTIKAGCLASMPGYSEVVFMPESEDILVFDQPVYDDNDSDWETRSAISL